MRRPTQSLRGRAKRAINQSQESGPHCQRPSGPQEQERPHDSTTQPNFVAPQSSPGAQRSIGLPPPVEQTPIEAQPVVCPLTQRQVDAVTQSRSGSVRKYVQPSWVAGHS